MGETRYLSRQNEPMAEAFGIKLLGWLGVPMFVIAWIMDIPEPMRSIAILAGLVMMIIRFVFWVDKASHAMWMRREERRKIKRDRGSNRL